eukprot:1708536-Heterocapsa_arctica.AAC.1
MVVARDFPDEQPTFVAAAIRTRLVVDCFWSVRILEEAGVGVGCDGQRVLDDTVEGCFRVLEVCKGAPGAEGEAGKPQGSSDC